MWIGSKSVECAADSLPARFDVLGSGGSGSAAEESLRLLGVGVNGGLAGGCGLALGTGVGSPGETVGTPGAAAGSRGRGGWSLFGNRRSGLRTTRRAPATIGFCRGRWFFRGQRSVRCIVGTVALIEGLRREGDG